MQPIAPFQRRCCKVASVLRRDRWSIMEGSQLNYSQDSTIKNTSAHQSPMLTYLFLSLWARSHDITPGAA